jgi:dienelactone hydrolase
MRTLSLTVILTLALLPATAAQAAPVTGAGVTAGAMLPAPTGPHPVGTVSLHLTDHARPDPLKLDRPTRELMVQLWYPATHPTGPKAAYLPFEAAGKVAGGSGDLPPELMQAVRTAGHEGAPIRRRHRGYPVVLYSPGLVDPRAFGTTVVQDLASHGFVVVAIDHTFDAYVVQFPGGRLEDTVWPDNLQAQPVRVADVRFVLAELARINAGRVVAGFRGQLDLTRTGMFGHSAGGAATANAIQAGLPITAGLNLDGSILPPAGEPGAVTNRPFLQLGGAYHTRAVDPTWMSYWNNLQGWRRELLVEGALHNDFTDLGTLLDQFGVDRHRYGDFGPIEPTRALRIQQVYVRAFFARTLLDSNQPLLDGPSTAFPEVAFTS